MLPTKRQYRKWTLPSKYSLVGVILSLAGIALSIIFWVVPLLDINQINEEWYIGTWKVDIKKSMPEFEKQYEHYRSVFGQDAMELMNRPQLGEGMEEAVYVFGKSAGQMVRDGRYRTNKGKVKDLDLPLSEDFTIKGDAEYSSYQGITSSVSFDLIQEPGPKTIMRVRNHDMRLDESLSHLAIPDGYILKEGNWMVVSIPYFIRYPSACEDALQFKGCDLDIKWFNSKMYLTHIK